MSTEVFFGYVVVWMTSGFISSAIATNVVFGNFVMKIPKFLRAICLIVSVISMTSLVIIAPGLLKGITEVMNGTPFVRSAVLAMIIYAVIFTLGNIFILIYIPLYWINSKKIKAN